MIYESSLSDYLSLKGVLIFIDLKLIFSVFKPVKQSVFNPFLFGLPLGRIWEMCQNPEYGESGRGNEMF